jgi:hypothetical protein
MSVPYLKEAAAAGEKFERTVTRDIAEAVVSEEKADMALLAPA